MPLQKNNYHIVLDDIKKRLRTARMQAVLVANAMLLSVYWKIGSIITEQMDKEGWGAKTIDKLSKDLMTEFEDMKGLSARNLRYMRDFYKAYPDAEILQRDVAKMQDIDNQSDKIWQQAVAKLPWGHHTVILSQLRDFDERIFYMQKCFENNWSRDVLSLQIKSKLFDRSGKAINNFTATIPSPNTDLAQAVFKNPYIFDFLAMDEKMQERDFEKALVQHLKQFMLELGKGFAYVGNQYQLKIAGDEFFLDLLFYNTKLHCYVVFELKMDAFKPEYAGKLNFYLNAIDAEIKTDLDAPTIGVLLCKTPNETVIKYALQGINKPIGVADYKLQGRLPAAMKKGLPTIEELEAELNREMNKLAAKPKRRKK